MHHAITLGTFFIFGPNFFQAALVLLCVLQTLHVTILRSHSAYLCIPGTALLVRELQYRQVTALGCDVIDGRRQKVSSGAEDL